MHMQGLDLLSDYDYIAIFDADFKPDSDFLVSALQCRCPGLYGTFCGSSTSPAHEPHACLAARHSGLACCKPGLTRVLSMCAPASAFLYAIMAP